MLEQLKTLLEALKSPLSEWQLKFVIEVDWPTMRKAHATPKMHTELTAFLEYAPKIEKLAKYTQALISAQEALAGE